jgi:hypothetical protein
MPSAPKLHHFVPQFYLRHWCDAEGKLWIYAIDGRNPFRATPKNFAAETNLYTAKADAPAAPTATEECLSAWESLFARVWPDIIDRADNQETRASIARFIATLIARHPYRPRNR